MNRPGDVAVGGVERFQSCAAGEFDPFEAKLTKFPLFCPTDNATFAFYAGATKSLH